MKEDVIEFLSQYNVRVTEQNKRLLDMLDLVVDDRVIIEAMDKRIEFLSDEHKEPEPNCRFCDLKRELQKIRSTKK